MKISREFDHIFGNDIAKNELTRLADQVRQPRKYQIYDVEPPKSILIFGPEGTGKRLLAEGFIKSAQLNAFSVTMVGDCGSDLYALTHAFQDAKEHARSAIVIYNLEEIINDSVFLMDVQKSIERSDWGVEARSNQESFDRIIEAAQKEDIKVVATLNDPYYIPREIADKGWFDETVEVYLFQKHDLFEIVREMMGRYPIEDTLYVPEVMSIFEGHSMSEVERVLSLAGSYAVFDGKSAIGLRDIVKAALKELYGLPDNDGRPADKIKERIAVHEAGHIITSEILNPGSVVFSTICHVPGSGAGHTLWQKPYDYDFDPEQMENRIVNLLGGKAATELIYGCADTGSGNDFDKATELIEILMYNVSGSSFASRPRLGISERTKRKIDVEIATHLNNSYCEAMGIITDNRNGFDSLVTGLLERQTLTAKDIRGLLRYA